MKQLTESLYAIVVPEDAKHPYITLCLDVYVLCYKALGNEPCARVIGFKSDVLGFVSQDTITFDVEPYVDKFTLEVASQRLIECGVRSKEVFENYVDDCLPYSNEQDSFRSLLTSKGINIEENTKLVIIKKL